MNYIANAIDDYFLKQGIQVRYNCLGDHDVLINSYIKESHDLFKRSNIDESHYMKSFHYNDWYNIKPREKQTGFEKVKKIDNAFRQTYRFADLVDQWDYPNYFYEVFDNDNEKYLINLGYRLTKIDNPIIFYSGGADSELLLTTFLDLGKPFKVVIFELVNNNGEVINQYDLDHASKFCKLNGIIPIVQKFNPQVIWLREEFLNIGKSIKNNSPQIITHAYMIHQVAEQYPNHTYCFAGEVRYKLDPFNKESKSVLVSSAKSTPALASNQYAQRDPYTFGNYSNASVFLWLQKSNGTWIQGCNGDFVQGAGNGTWTNTPANPYVTVTGWNGVFTVRNPVATTNWSMQQTMPPVSVGNPTVCSNLIAGVNSQGSSIGWNNVTLYIASGTSSNYGPVVAATIAQSADYFAN